MDQQKMFNQMVPSNYITHGLKHTRSDRDHLASIPICAWLTHTKIQSLFPKGVLLFPGIQNVPGNKAMHGLSSPPQNALKYARILEIETLQILSQKSGF